MGSACCTAEKVPFPETPTLSRQTRPLQKNNCTIPRLTLRQSSSEISLGTGNHEHLASRSLSPQHLESSARLKISARGTSANGRSNGPSSRRKLYTAVPGRHFIAIRSHLPQASGEIALQKNDRVKVLSIGEGGYWEGICRGQVGWFPSKCVEEIPIRLGKERPKSRIELNNRKKLFRHFTVGSNDSFDSCSDCVAEQKIVVLQKQDSEGFGFVLRGAKADTPIEEFTPTAAFPALQYLESVDEGGVAWLMGLRTGDFLIEINHQNVVKLGHRQVVNMIRMGGNRLVIKVVRVSRNLDPDNKSCKKAPPPPKRAATTALSMRSKTLTPELEESDLGEKFQSQKPVQEKMLVDKIGLIKRPPSSRLLNLNGNTAAPPVPARAHGGFFGLSKGSMKRQKSIGNPEEEKKFLIPPSLRFNRSLSMPDKSEDIPPPPGVSPPSPPYKQSATMTRVYEPNQSIYTQTLIGKGHTIHRDHAGYRHTSEQYDSRVLSATLPNGATIPENPYSEESMKALYVPAKPVRRKGVLVKQPNVEDSPEKTCSIQIPTIIVKEPSTSSSGKSSQGSSMEIDLPTSTSPSQFSFEGSPNSSNPFAAAIAGAVRDREKRLEARKSIPAFMSLDLGDEDPFISPPCLRQSVSIDEAMFGNADSLQKHLALPTTLLEFQTIARGSRMISDNPELAEHLNRHRVTSPCLSTSVGLPPVINTSLSVRSPQHKVNEGTHDICLAARDNHVEQAQLFSKFDKANPNQPLFINTKLPSNPDANFVVSSEASLSGDCQRRLKNSPDFIQSTVKTKEGVPEKMKNYLGQQTSEGLLMVHTLEKTKSHVNQSDGFKQVIINANNPLNKPIDCIDKRVKNTVTVSHLPHLKSVTPRSSIIENVKVSFNIPPPLGSVDVDEEVDEEPLPPPLEFANSIDSVEDQKVEIPRRIKSCVTQANLSHYHSHVSKTDAGYKRLSGHGSYTSTLSYPPTLSEGFESVPQSERLGKRNNGESQFETNTTLSAVSSISTLSSVGIEDTFMVYSDGENILLEQPPVPPKPRMKPIINKSNAFCRNSLVEEIAESFGQLPPPPQECLEQSETHNALPHCGTNVCDDSIELPKPFGVNADPKANVINELSSKLQQLNKDRFPNQEESMAGAGLIDLRESDADDFCTSPGHLLLPGSSPVSPPSGPNTGHSSSLPTAVTSPTLTDNFSLPTPPIVNPEQCCSPSSSQCQSPPPFMTYHPGRPVQLWTKYDVADWLESLNLAEHRKAFMENEIDGSHLPNLLKDDLVDLGVSRVGHRMNIERALKHLMDDGM